MYKKWPLSVFIYILLSVVAEKL